MSKAMELRAEALKIEHQAKAKLNEITGSTPEARATEIEAEFDRMIADADSMNARAQRFEDLEAREAAYNTADPRRPVEDRAATEQSTLSAEERHANAFNAHIRGHEMSREEREAAREFRDQNVGSNSAGGYLVPAQFQANLIVGLKAYGPLNDGNVINYVETSQGNKQTFPKMDDTANKGRMIGEATAAWSNAGVTFSTIDLDAYKGTSDVILVSSELLNDSAVDVQSVLIDAMAERIGRLVNYQLTLGTGTGAPNGIVTAVGTPSLTGTGVANSVVADDVLNLIHSVDPAYRGNPKAALMFSDTTLLSIRKLKDTTGAYIWQPGMQVGQAPTIFGYKYYINQDMASVGSAGAVPILFGDFGKYTARRVKNFVLKRLDERYADSDQVGFLGFVRFDGDLMDSRAVKGIKV